MFDFSWAEIILIVIVSMVFIGPKDFPNIVRWFSDFIKKARKLAGEFHSHVDDMVKDPDLKAVKDQLMQLRHMNVKGVILNTIDRDGGLRDTFSNPPLAYTDPINSPSPSYITEDHTLKGGAYQGFDPHEEKEALDQPVDLEALEKADPAPLFLPPHIAQRLQVRRASPPSPSMIPPQIAKYKEQRHW